MSRFKRKPKHVESILQALPDFRSGVEKNSRETTTRERRQLRAARGQRAAAVLVLIGILFMAGYLVHSRSIGAVEASVTTSGVGYVPLNEADVALAAVRYLEESFINKWLVNNEVLAERVASSVPAVARLDITRQGRSLQLEVEARQRAVFWQQDNEIYEVDTGGVAFRKANTEQAANNILVVDRSKIPVEMFQNVAAQTTVAMILDLVALTSEAEESGSKYRIEQFIIPEASRELHLKLVGEPYTIKLLTEQSPDIAFQALFDALNYLKGNGIQPDRVVDLRVDGRAAYR